MSGRARRRSLFDIWCLGRVAHENERKSSACVLSFVGRAYGKPNRGQGLSLFRPRNVRCVRLSSPTQRAGRSILDDGKCVALIAMWTRRGSMIAQACQTWLGSGPSRRSGSGSVNPRPTVGGDGEQVSVGDIRDKEAVRRSMGRDNVLGRSDGSR